jgi:hypothetical protein
MRNGQPWRGWLARDPPDTGGPALSGPVLPRAPLLARLSGCPCLHERGDHQAPDVEALQEPRDAPETASEGRVGEDTGPWSHKSPYSAALSCIGSSSGRRPVYQGNMPSRTHEKSFEEARRFSGWEESEHAERVQNKTFLS